MRPGDLISILVLSGLVVAVMAAAEGLKRWPRASQEFTRKFVHVFAGLIAITLPYLFESHWPVLLLTGRFFLILVVSARAKLLDSIHGVERRSAGAFLYPVSIYLLFVLSRGDALLFQVPILILLLSDTLAALVGQSYGRLHYRVGEGERSLEGSLAFLIATFLVVHIPILLWGGTSREESLLIALVLAVLVTGFEALSIRGWDNFLIPAGSFLFLQRLLGLPAEELLSIVLIVGLLAVVCFSPYTYRRLTVSGAIGVFLLGMILWILGGLWWLVPQVVLYLTYPVFATGARGLASRVGKKYSMSLIFHHIFPSVLLVFAWAYTGEPWLYGAYLVSIGAQFAIIWPSFYDVRQGTTYLERSAVTPRHVAIVLAGAAIPAAFVGVAPAGFQLAPAWVGLVVAAGGLAFFFQRLYLWRIQVLYRCPECGETVDVTRHCNTGTVHLRGIPRMTYSLGVMFSGGLAVLVWLGLWLLL